MRPPKNWPLSRIDQNRRSLLKKVVEDTFNELRSERNNRSFAELLAASAATEQRRLRNEKWSAGNAFRLWRDNNFWKHVNQALQSADDKKIDELTHKAIERFAKEIASHRFNHFMYFFASRLVPFSLSWMLNVASVGQLAPWRLQQQLKTKIELQGHTRLLQELSREGTVLLLPTHQSNLDSLVVSYAIDLLGLPPFAFGAGLNLFANPLVGFCIGHLGAYTVDRRKKAPLYKHTLFEFSTRLIKEGVHSVFFPGGTRSRNGEIETQLKLGLLGTAQQAAAAGRKVFLVPMVLSYDSVLEASLLIRDKANEDETDACSENDKLKAILAFLWRFFSKENTITIRIGQPLDAYGNLITDPAQPLAEPLDAERLLSGEARATLGRKLGERFLVENTVLPSHFAAFVTMNVIKRRLASDPNISQPSPARTATPFSEILPEANRVRALLIEKAQKGKLHLSSEFLRMNTEACFRLGAERVGAFHAKSVITLRPNFVMTEDTKLLGYYANRLNGYKLEEAVQQETLLRPPCLEA
jgi:glycerol-3-phosphate O-acyltransferase